MFFPPAFLECHCNFPSKENDDDMQAGESNTENLYILGNGMIMRDGKSNRIVRDRKTDMGYGDVVLVEARSVNSYYYPENCQRVGDYIQYTNSQKIYIPAILHMTQT